MSETPLALHLKHLLRTHGSVSVEYFMELCLHHPEHGYYRRAGQFGSRGDFVTAPDISQAFGELIGLWCGIVWQQMGAPSAITLIELGPGRGTLMADALRAARAVSGFRDALNVHLVETSGPLRAQQLEKLADVPRLSTSESWPPVEKLAAGPVIVIANEYLDALPIEQFVFADGLWRMRCVTLDAEDRFAFAPGSGQFQTMGVSAEPTPGDIFESCGGVLDLAADLDTILDTGRDVAALFIDYGHTASAFGDTLQGVKAHRYVSPFETPGETDLTAQVDFAALAAAFARTDTGADFGVRPMGLTPSTLVEPVVTQAEFLGTLGIMERASRLMAANPSRAGDIEAGVARLMAPNGMGTRFKVLGVRSAGLPPLPGFPVG